MEEKAFSLTRWVKAAVHSLEKNGFVPFKTTVLKTLYLSLPREQRQALFEPYLYGPYSDTISNLLNDLGFNYDSLKINMCELPNGKWATIFGTKDEGAAPDAEITDKIDEILMGLQEFNLRTANQISLVSKAHFLKDLCSTSDPELLSKQAEMIGWDLDPSQLQHYLNVVSSLNIE